MSKLFQIKIGIIAGVVGLTFALTPMQAQTCTVAPASLQALSLERVLTLSNVLSTQTAAIPVNILASITGGAQEIRERLVFNPQATTLTSTVFLVAAGSPNPTPIGVDLTQSTLEAFTLNIDRIYTSCKPLPNVLLVGTIGQSSGGINTPTGLFGSFIGAPAAISIGYTTDNPAKVNNAVVVIAGTVVDFSASASGTLTFPPSPVTPPGSSGAPSIVIVPALPTTTGSRIQVVTNPLHLDASATTDPNGKTLTFQYTSVPPVAFSPSANVPNPDVQFPSAGDFTITLTVTNSAGLVSTIQLPFQFVGRPGF